jgi:hypothetical protein
MVGCGLPHQESNFSGDRTMRIICLFTLMCIFAVQAQDSDWQQFMDQSAYGHYAVTLPQDNSAPVAVAAAPHDLKSPKKALLLSALLPGTGQFYNGSYWWAAGFLTVEVLSWTSWASYNKKGNDIDAEFHQFANAHWSEPAYWRWVSGHAGIAYLPENMEALRAWERDHFSHGLHVQKDQQYYEMIGKYDQFNAGWDDSNGKGLLDSDWSKSLRTPRRLFYDERRHDSNRAFKNATWGITAVLLNHLLSAAEAAYAAKVNNDKLTFNIQLEPRTLNGELYSCLNMRLRW